MKPASSGYVPANGIRLWYEIHGRGEPLVLVHGGLTTIGEMDRWVRPLAKARQVIAVEMQGHGHTADTERPLSFDTMGDDIAVLLDQLAIPEADLVGHSFGGAVVMRAAIRHPEKVRRLVVLSSPYASSGWYPQARQGMSEVGASMTEGMMRTPTGRLSRYWPEPHGFAQFLDKLGKLLSEGYDWSAQVVNLPMPVLLVFADNDSISQKHIAEFFALLGGGVSEPGWRNTQLSKSRLAVVSGYSHYDFITSREAPPIILKFLADPLAPSASAAAASQAVRASRKTQ